MVWGYCRDACGIMQSSMKSEERWTKWSRPEQANYFRELRPYTVASVLLIVAGAIFGIVIAIFSPEIAGARSEALKEFSRLFLGLSKPYLALAIFLNNSLKTLAVVVLGIFAGLLPLVFLLVNGYVLGLVLHASLQSKGLSVFFLAVAPHGLFELPAILLGTSIGLMLGARVLSHFFGKREGSLGNDLARGLRFFVTVIVPMLLLAALIEAFVTSALASK
jgi:stage II sporulation protein M